MSTASGKIKFSILMLQAAQLSVFAIQVGLGGAKKISLDRLPSTRGTVFYAPMKQLKMIHGEPSAELVPNKKQDWVGLFGFLFKISKSFLSGTINSN